MLLLLLLLVLLLLLRLLLRRRLLRRRRRRPHNNNHIRNHCNYITPHCTTTTTTTTTTSTVQLQLQLHCAASNCVLVHRFIRSAIHHSQQLVHYRFPILSLKLPPPPCAVHTGIYPDINRSFVVIIVSKRAAAILLLKSPWNLLQNPIRPDCTRSNWARGVESPIL